MTNQRKFTSIPEMPLGQEGMTASIMNSERGPETLLKISDPQSNEDVRLWFEDAEDLYKALGLALGKPADEVKP